MHSLKIHRVLYILLLISVILSCERIYEGRKDTELREDQVYDTYSRVINLGYNAYNYLPEGYNSIDGAYFAGASDEGEHSWSNSRIRLINEGSWSQYDNPDEQWESLYEGIRVANLFLEKSMYPETFVVADTFTPTDMFTYERELLNVAFMRAEVRFLRAFFHFELVKRYGGIPIVGKTIELDGGLDIPRSSYDDCIQYIVNECDSVKDHVIPTFKFFDNTREGRVTTGTVLALKNRARLYAASPLYNPSGEPSKWLAAAEAAKEFLDLNSALKLYTLHGDYGELFLPPNSFDSPEVIWSRRYGEGNFVERANYPSGTDGGQSGTCPSQNLVAAYEKLPDWDPNEPYKLRDPRLNMTVVVNNSTWNDRTIELWEGGRDLSKSGLEGASKTGYYLKKFLVDNLDLSLDQTAIHAWIEFRYAEVLLNYAEAVNEAFNFDEVPPGYPMSSRDALNMVRARSSMPDVVAGTQDELRERIKHERRIELAFEGHRIWDARRWQEAENILGADLMGISAERVNDTVFNYTEFKVEDRVFQSHMYLYPVPQQELIKYSGSMAQNPGW